MSDKKQPVILMIDAPSAGAMSALSRAAASMKSAQVVIATDPAEQQETPTPRTAKECIRAVVEELRLDTTDPFTRLLAIACGMQDAHYETKAALSRCQDEVHRLRDEMEKLERELSAANAQIAALREALKQAHDAMEAFTDPEGNMPADTGEFRELKAAMLSIRSLLGAPK